MSSADAIGGSFLDLQSIVKRFGDFEALRSVDLEISEGEFLTLLGPSGCGKSTLLRIISGLEQATSGAVVFRGNDVAGVSPEQLPFNMVFQSYALFPHMTVAQNVCYGPRTAGVGASEIKAKLSSALALVHLEDHGNRGITELSGGQRQRVALARALINEPQVLLLDEPLGALDLQLRKRLQEELRGIQERLGTTFIYVTHDQEEALVLSDRIAVVNAGEIVQVATPTEVYEEPNTRFVAEFIGEANLLPCRAVGEEYGLVDVALPGGDRLRLRGSAARVTVGSDALAMVRPEHLEFVELKDADLTGTIDCGVFLGSHFRHQVRLSDGTELKVHLPPSEKLEEGTEVGLRLRSGHGVVVPDDAEDVGDASPQIAHV